jgi:hypothetical protein
MKTYYRNHNKGECYALPLNVVKSMFETKNITINFGFFGRKYKPHPNETGYKFYEKHIKGDVILRLFIQCGTNSSMMSFYIIKESDYPSNLRNEFEKITKKVLDFYNENVLSDNKYAIFLVELLNGKLIIHKELCK